MSGLATLSVVARLATYIATAAAVPVLRRKRPSTQALRLPGGVAIPAVAMALTVGLLASASWTDLMAGAVGLAVGWVIYVLRRTG